MELGWLTEFSFKLHAFPFQVILSEKKFDFLKELVSTIPDVQQSEDSPGEKTIHFSAAQNMNSVAVEGGC